MTSNTLTLIDRERNEIRCPKSLELLGHLISVDNIDYFIPITDNED